MEISKAISVMNSKISELEEEMYSYEFIIKPRAEADAKILYAMKEQLMKLQTLQARMARSEEISVDDVEAVVPKMFR